MLDCTCDCHADIEDCSQCCFKHKLIENAKRENAALCERIGVLGECLHVMSKNLEGIENIRSITGGFHERISDIEEKITKLQEAYHADAQLSDRIDGLETEINTVRELGSRAFHPKKPHKCPVCKGLGNDKGMTVQSPTYDFAMQYASCHACEGKSIVWG